MSKDELEKEFERRNFIARRLAGHLLRMGAAKAEFSINVDGTEINITLERAERPENCKTVAFLQERRN